MKVKIDGQDLVIRMKMSSKPQPSASGKTLIVCTTSGNKPTEVKIKGQTLIVGCNAYIKNNSHAEAEE